MVLALNSGRPWAGHNADCNAVDFEYLASLDIFDFYVTSMGEIT